MKEDYCSYNLSKLAKEAGFNWPVKSFYYFIKNADTSPNMWPGKLISELSGNNFNETNEKISVPTHCHLAKWLREKHNIIVLPYVKEDEVFRCDIFKKEDSEIRVIFSREGYNTYENAYESGLMEALKML